MKRLFLLNPNTTEAVTQKMANSVAGLLPADMGLRALTAAFGAPYISDEVSYAVAQHAVVELLERCVKDHQVEANDRILIGCFGDPGLFAMKEAAPCFVTGLAEAAFEEAASHGPFVVLTGGAKWAAMLQRLATALGFGKALHSIVTLEATGAQMAADPEQAKRWLAAECHQILKNARSQGAQLGSIIIGGAGLVGYADAIAAEVPCRLIDSVYAGVHRCLQA